MTSAVSSAENGRAPVRRTGKLGDWFVPQLYLTELKAGWAQGLFFAIVLFFCIPVAALLITGGNYYTACSTPDIQRAHILEFVGGFFGHENPTPTIWATFTGFFTAFVSSGYLFNRRRTDYACSLPVKRQAMFLTRSAAGASWAVLAWIPAGIILLFVVLGAPHLRPYLGSVMAGFCGLFFQWLCEYLYFFGLTQLGCSLCGTGIMSCCTALFFAGYLPVVMLLGIWMLSRFRYHAYEDFYLSAEVFDRLSGVFRLWRRTIDYKSAGFLLINALIGLVFLALAVLLVMKRRSEHAEQPFAYGKFRSIVKYCCMAAAGVFGGLLFGEIGSGAEYAWMLFGAACGVILGWMLCNTIFYKTPKMMFDAKRGMLILLACVVVFMALFPFDLFHMDTYIPSPSVTDRVDVNLNYSDAEITIRDPELIAQFTGMVKRGIEIEDQYGYSADAWDDTPYDGNAYAEPRVFLRPVWRTRLGIPVAKRAHVRADDYDAFLAALADRYDLIEMLLERTEAVIADCSPADTLQLDIQGTGFRVTFGSGEYGSSIRVSGRQAKELLETYRKELDAHEGGVTMQQYIPCVLCFRYHSNPLPLFSWNTETLKLLEALLGDDDMANFSMTLDGLPDTVGSIDLYHNGELVRSVSRAEFDRWADQGLIACTEYLRSYLPLVRYEEGYTASASYEDTIWEQGMIEVRFSFLEGAAEIIDP